MSIWARISEFLTTVPAAALSSIIEAVRTALSGDPQLRRRVAFSIAMIALSAKMAKADGIVTQNEIRAFRQIFIIPPDQERNVARLFDLAKQDIAGFEAYAERLAGLCSDEDPGCGLLEDVLDGLLHIAAADGMVHEREVAFLRRVSQIFAIGEERFETILSRHALSGDINPWRVLGLELGAPFPEVKAKYRRMVADNHPDRLIARGVPEEFLAIANRRLATINAAYEMIERSRRPA